MLLLYCHFETKNTCFSIINSMETKKNTSKTRLICFYVRNSTLQQEYQYQIDNLTNHLNRFNDVKLVKIFAEKISGFTNERDRPAMNEMLNFVKSGGCTECWCNDFARLSRDAVNLQNIVKECAEYNVNIYFHSNNLYSLDDNGEQNLTSRLIISNLALFAEMDAKSFKSKGMQGKISKSKQNKYVGGTLPTGYTYSEFDKDKKIVIDPIKKKVVEYVFDCIANRNMTLNATAKLLNNLKNIDKDFDTVMRSKGYGMKNDKWLYNSWTSSQIQSIIKCTWYALGFRVFKEEKINLDESLKFLDLDLYNRANEKMKSNQFVKTNRKHDYLMKELIYCECGDKMYPASSGIRFTYRCNKNKQHDVDKNIKCDIGKNIEIERLENIVWCIINQKLPEFKVSIENKANKEVSIKQQIEQNNRIIENIKTDSLPKLEEQKQRAISLAIKFDTDITEQMKNIENQIKEENLTLKNLLSENTKLELSIKEINLTDEIQNQLSIIESDKQLVNYYSCKLIKKITVMGGLFKELYNVIKIEWNDTVNSMNDTFVLYKSKQIHDASYYYITSDSNVNIEWSNANQEMIFINNNTNECVGIPAKKLINRLKEFFSNESVNTENKRFFKGELKSIDIIYGFNSGEIENKFQLN